MNSLHKETPRAVLFSLFERLEFDRKVCTSQRHVHFPRAGILKTYCCGSGRDDSHDAAVPKDLQKTAALKTPSRSTDGMSLNCQNPWWCQSKTSERRQPRRAWTARVRDHTGWRSASVHHTGDHDAPAATFEMLGGLG